MADATVTGVEVRDGTLHVTGTGFTQTTTTVFVDGESVPFDYVSATELTVSPAPSEGSEITVGKGDVVSEPQTVSAASGGSTGTGDSKPVGEPNVSTAAEGDDDYADVGANELPDDGPTPPEQLTEEVEQERVQTIQSQGIGPRDPYPTGNPGNNPLAAPDHGYNQARGLSSESPNPTAGNPTLPNPGNDPVPEPDHPTGT